MEGQKNDQQEKATKQEDWPEGEKENTKQKRNCPDWPEREKKRRGGGEETVRVEQMFKSMPWNIEDKNNISSAHTYTLLLIITKKKIAFWYVV